MTMSRYWVRNQVTDALERNPSCHGVPARYSKMPDEVGIISWWIGGILENNKKITWDESFERACLTQSLSL